MRDQGCGPLTQLYGLLHDAAEAYVVDLPRPVKVALPAYQAVEARVEGAILAHFGIEPNDADRELVKHADNVLLATERRDLMPATAGEWAGLPEPLAGRIIPWPRSMNVDGFMRRARELSAAVRAFDGA